jgi:hypothetical protein
MRGQTPVDLDQFRTLPSSMATGAQQIGRLTNLMQLSVDTSWYTRYRSATNPDFGATFAQAIPALANGQFQAIPKTDADMASADRAQALANTAAFHFGFIEQGGSSLYATLAQKARTRKFCASCSVSAETRLRTSSNGSTSQATACNRLWLL